MKQLNLEAKTKEQQRIKAYLEENASDILAGKINNGVLIKKDGKILLNRKTMDSYSAGLSTISKRTASKARSTTRTAPNTRRSPSRRQRRRR